MTRRSYEQHFCNIKSQKLVIQLRGFSNYDATNMTVSASWLTTVQGLRTYTQ